MRGHALVGGAHVRAVRVLSARERTVRVELRSGRRLWLARGAVSLADVGPLPDVEMEALHAHRKRLELELERLRRRQAVERLEELLGLARRAA